MQSNSPTEPESKVMEGPPSHALERVCDAFVALDRDWRYTYANMKAGQIFGRGTSDLIGKHFWTEFPEAVDQPFYHAYHRALAEQVFVEIEEYYPPSDRWFEHRVYPTPDGVSIFFRDITERKHVEALAQGQSQILEMIARGKPVTVVFNALLRFVDSQHPDLLSSILLLDEEGLHLRHAASPSIPEVFSRAIDGVAIGPCVGSCGTSAYRGEPVIVEDIATDPLWAAFCHLALPHGLRACWSTPIFDPSGRVLGTFAIYYRRPGRPTPWHMQLIEVVTQVTAIAIVRARDEAALRASEARYRAAFDNMLEGCQLIAFDWSYLYLNATAAKHNRRPVEELLGRKMMEAWPGIEASRVFALFRRCMEERIAVHDELEFVFPDGASSWFDLRSQPVPEGIFALSIDITERKQAEANLRASEERFRQIAENIEEVFWMRDVAKNQMLYVSPGYEAIWGRTRESLYASSHSWSESIHADDRDRVAQTMMTRNTKDGSEETYRIVRPDGTVRWVRDRAFPVRNQAGQVFRIVGTAEDISIRKQAELRLKLQHAVTSILAEAGSSTEINPKILETLCRGLQAELAELWMVDRGAKVLRCAGKWHHASADFLEFVEESRRCTFVMGQGLPGQVWASGQSDWSPDAANDPRAFRRAEAARSRLHGWIGFPVKIRSEVLGVLGFLFREQTREPEAETIAMLSAFGIQIGLFIERQQLTEQFRQAQKMEAIGTLAGGIAHDFNNVLAAIDGYTELAKMQVSNDAVAGEYLDAVLHGSKRAADLVQQILAFSRRQEIERKTMQLRPAVTEALTLLRATIPKTIQFEISLADNTSNVLTDTTQIHQIVMNLCTNAAHAMKDGPGRLTVKLENFRVDTELSAIQTGLGIGPYVRLSVTDTGCGMDKATLSRIFEPFFTTKAPGHGTGLGLAVVHGIIQSHEGVVTVESKPDEGTTFHLYFPASVGEVEEAIIAPADAPRGRGERILCVDDEGQLATMMKSILERLGYRVDAHSDPLDALTAVQSAPDAYDLVLTDQMMPTLTGTGLAERIHALQPQLPVILVTGYAPTLSTERIQTIGIRKLLMKPFSVDALAMIVALVLAEAKLR